MEETVVQPTPNDQPVRFELNQPNDYSKYLLYSKTEILAVLRTLIQKGAMITVHFDHGNAFLLTSLIALGGGNSEIILDVGSDSEMNRKALQASKLIFTTFIDKVKIQFTLDKLSSSQYEGHPAFVGVVPDKLLRLQRREFFRLSIPVANPVSLSATITLPDESLHVLDIPLWDISGGGVGMMATTEQAGYIQRGDILKDCSILLPDEGTLVVNLEVRNMFEVTSRNGTRMVRIGCEFVDVPSSRLNVVQRYITRIERERKARLNGVA